MPDTPSSPERKPIKKALVVFEGGIQHVFGFPSEEAVSEFALIAMIARCRRTGAKPNISGPGANFDGKEIPDIWVLGDEVISTNGISCRPLGWIDLGSVVGCFMGANPVAIGDSSHHEVE